MTMKVPVRPMPALNPSHCLVIKCLDVYKRYMALFQALPAVHGDGPGIQDALLLQVDLLQEVQDTTGVCGHAVVGPGSEVVLPDRALCVALKPCRRQFQSGLEQENICS